jgi:hypothetical protein
MDAFSKKRYHHVYILLLPRLKHKPKCKKKDLFLSFVKIYFTHGDNISHIRQKKSFISYYLAYFQIKEVAERLPLI